MVFSRRQIVFFHPDLGIGGAERLVIDAAVGLKELGHKVTIFTSHCDKSHCFEEARDGTLDVRVRGNTIFPHNYNNRFQILCAALRQLHLILQICYFTKELQSLQPEVFVVDQLSAGIPLLRSLMPDARILFYCHFPDKLLAKKGGFIKWLYRIPFNWLESWSTGASDLIVVNSNFTKSIFTRAFPSLSYRRPRVVYPCVDVDKKFEIEPPPFMFDNRKIFLSINRFERKKNVALALRAYSRLSLAQRKQAKLVIAGGYDPRVEENVQYHKSLRALADTLNLTQLTIKDASSLPSIAALPPDVEVSFLLSVPDQLKAELIQAASFLIYTPAFEHFGIVPLEAMLAKKPVLAANVGGPTETVMDGETGWLRDVDDVPAWTNIMTLALQDKSDEKFEDMGERGHDRVREDFSRSAMTQRLHQAIEKMLSARTRPAIMDDREIIMLIVYVLGFFLVFLFGFAWILARVAAFRMMVRTAAYGKEL